MRFSQELRSFSSTRRSFFIWGEKPLAGIFRPFLEKCLRAILLPALLSVSVPASRGAEPLPSPAIRRVINVKDFGARGDGQTDDTAAIQKALDNLAKALQVKGERRAGASLVFPDGNYLVSRRLNLATETTAMWGQGLLLRGAGPNRSVLVSKSPDGLLWFRLAANTPLFNFNLLVEDLGLRAARPAAGSALEVTTLQRDESDITPRVTAKLCNVRIDGLNARDGFRVGFKGAHLFEPVMDRVVLLGPRDGQAGVETAFLFEKCYAYTLRDCQVSDARIGLDAPFAAEGNMVNRCRFTNVDIAVQMLLVPGQVPGPSGMDGKVLNSVIAARRMGVLVDGKSAFTIANNRFTTLAGEKPYTDVVLRDSRRSIVSGNDFSGGGAARTGVAVERGGKPPSFAPTSVAISGNHFGTFGTGIALGEGVLSNLIFKNVFESRRSVADQGQQTLTAITPPSLARQLHTSPAAAASKPLAPWAVFTNGSEIVDVASFGAVGDGLADDTAALQKAASQFAAILSKNRSAAMYFPPGTYRLGQPMRVAVPPTAKCQATIFGEGASISVIECHGNNGIFDLRIPLGVALSIHHLSLAAMLPNAGSAINVVQSAAPATGSSFQLYDVRIRGEVQKGFFNVSVHASGCVEPILRALDIHDYSNFDAPGTVGISLTGIAGLECEQVGCNGMENGLVIENRDAPILIKNGHCLAQVRRHRGEN